MDAESPIPWGVLGSQADTAVPKLCPQKVWPGQQNLPVTHHVTLTWLPFLASGVSLAPASKRGPTRNMGALRAVEPSSPLSWVHLGLQ